MSPRRGERVAPPAAEDEWEVVFANNDAAKGLGGTVPGRTRKHARRLAGYADKAAVLRDHRHGQLRGTLATGDFSGRQMDRWQIEVTGGARIWYLIDDDRRTVWLVHAGASHPKATE